MDIEEIIYADEEKETIQIIKVNYYINTKNDPNINFCLLLHDPHDLMKAVDERNRQKFGRTASTGRRSAQSNASMNFHKLKKQKLMRFRDTESDDPEGELRTK